LLAVVDCHLFFGDMKLVKSRVTINISLWEAVG
jgi:hypothetical protein